MTFHPRLTYEAFTKVAPQAHKALVASGTAVDEMGLDKALSELIKLRASQLNGCAFCIQYHLNVARKLGVPQTKLDLVAAWREAGIYSPREMAALDLTESLIQMTPESASDRVYEAVRRQFSEAETFALIIAISTINQWNRIAVALRFAPPIPTAGTAS